MAPPQPFILVPLYIYPTATSWQPLLDAAAAHPELAFKVVVNPANGPGSSELPDANYLAGLAALAALSNVQVLGYVHCSWGQRERAAVEQDVLVYAGWASRSVAAGGAPLRVDGIFLDEAPADAGQVGAMAATARFIRGRLDVRPAATVIYNPGMVVHAAFYQAADHVVVFENFTAELGARHVQAALEKLTPELRRKSVVLVHSCGTHEQQLRLSERVLVEYGFPGQLITTDAGYTAWCGHWEGYWRGFAAVAARWEDEQSRHRKPGAGDSNEAPGVPPNEEVRR